MAKSKRNASPPKIDSGSTPATPLGQGWVISVALAPERQTPPIAWTARIDRDSSVSENATPASPTRLPISLVADRRFMLVPPPPSGAHGARDLGQRLVLGPPVLRTPPATPG